MRLDKKRHRGHWLGLALGGILSMAATAQPAHAFSYASGDVIGIFVDGSTELLVNLGQASALTAGSTFTFTLPESFGSDGALGASSKFLALSTSAPFSGSLGRNLTFTTRAGVDPTTYNSQIVAYVNKLGLAQLALDDGDAVPDKFLQSLTDFPAAGNGGVILNDALRLSILTSNSSSYTSKIGAFGANDRVNGNLPFETSNALDASSVSVELWKGVKVTNTSATSTLLGSLQVEGNVGGTGNTARITFVPVPEPGTLLLLTSGLLGLVWSGRKPRLA